MRTLLLTLSAAILISGAPRAAGAMEAQTATLSSKVLPALPTIVRLPTTKTSHVAVETDSRGVRTLYPTRGGRANRRAGVSVTAALWSPAPEPQLLVSCYTFHATQSSTGNTVCGVTCTDGSIYRMGCGAAIFEGGFDITITE